MMIFAIFLYSVLALITYGGLINSFFQQDEWLIFGLHIYSDKAKLTFLNRLLFFGQGTHFTPFTNILSFLQYRLFGLNFFYYAYSSIAFQILNSILVYILARILLKKSWVAALAGIFFLINSISHQAITWIATTNGTAGSTTVFLLSLICFSLYLSGSKKRIRLWATFLLFFISLLFKETTVFAFIFFPLFWFFLSKKKTIRSAIRILFPLGLFGMMYILFRLFLMLVLTTGTDQNSALVQPSFVVYLSRIIITPVRVLAQSFLPVQVTLRIARTLVVLAYPHFVTGHTPDPYIVESVASDIIFFFFFCAIILIRFIAIHHLKKVKLQRIATLIDVSLVFIATSALPFIFVPGTAGYLSLLDGRHLYLTGVFTSILTSILVYVFYLICKRKKVMVIFLLILVGAACIYNVLRIRKDISYQVAIADQRVPILEKITSLYPTLPKKVIFYITSDTPYYGLPYGESVVPFQSGFGQTLLVWYSFHGANFPACMFKDGFLYELTSENYRECSGSGFGYFRKVATLNQLLQLNKLQITDIIAFQFISSTNSFNDVTNEVREQITRFGHL